MKLTKNSNKHKKPKITEPSNKFKDSILRFGHYNLKNQTNANIEILNPSCNKLNYKVSYSKT